ncbi:MAG: amino acid permease, partial [Gammaproteobacteria bacterium]|nr:amino acid permease [Gammaproteobacteria bacterium]
VAVELAAIAGLTTVILVMLMGQPRIFYAMSKDGLLPRFFSAVHTRFRTPHKGTVLVALVAFATVCLGVMVLRRTRPELHRPFRAPAVYLVGTLGVLACLGLVAIMPLFNWIVLLCWTLLGLCVYIGYGYRHSKLRQR